MTTQTQGRIRHIALSVKDPWETAEFYKQAVGLEEVLELDGPLAEGVFLSDGVVNLAILHFKNDEAAQGTGTDFVGIHHIGFWVDDVVEQGRIARNTGATWIMGDTNNPQRLRDQAHRPRRHHLRHRRPRLGRFAEEPGSGRQRRAGATRNGGWRSSTSAARGPRRRSPRSARSRSPSPPSDVLTKRNTAAASPRRRCLPRPDQARFSCSTRPSPELLPVFSSTLLSPALVAISMRRGFIASGTSRTRSISSRPCSNEAPFTFT